MHFTDSTRRLVAALLDPVRGAVERGLAGSSLALEELTGAGHARQPVWAANSSHLPGAPVMLTHPRERSEPAASRPAAPDPQPGRGAEMRPNHPDHGRPASSADLVSAAPVSRAPRSAEARVADAAHAVDESPASTPSHRSIAIHTLPLLAGAGEFLLVNPTLAERAHPVSEPRSPGAPVVTASLAGRHEHAIAAPESSQSPRPHVHSPAAGSSQSPVVNPAVAPLMGLPVSAVVVPGSSTSSGVRPVVAPVNDVPPVAALEDTHSPRVPSAAPLANVQSVARESPHSPGTRTVAVPPGVSASSHSHSAYAAPPRESTYSSGPHSSSPAAETEAASHPELPTSPGVPVRSLAAAPAPPELAPLRSADAAVADRVSQAMRPVLDSAAAWTDAALRAPDEPRVANNFAVHVQLGGAVDPDALGAALVDMLREAARRHGLEV